MKMQPSNQYSYPYKTSKKTGPVAFKTEELFSINFYLSFKIDAESKIVFTQFAL